MKKISYFLLFAVITTAYAAPKNLPSPIKTPEISIDNSAEAIEKAKTRGIASAKEDIKKGVFRILYYGKPWDIAKPLVDSDTGYAIQIIAGCDCTEVFRAEVDSYNATVRNEKKSNHPVQSTSLRSATDR